MNGSVSLQYGDFIKEIKEDMADGVLDESSDLLILRSDDPILIVTEDGGKKKEFPYYPIKDWYYDDLVSERDMAPDPTDGPEDIDGKRKYRDDFARDRPKMRSMKVRDVISELEDLNQLV